ncbi:serine hydrolase domain-containing protein [Leucobacter triazinivorans]|uniref:Class A beta-lactamase-related serine hydrolase n=1 Tax=Leucobacter triazinivorans TaxID=1784719 RepID=A0A4P6KC28_9MICO|nr:serine hydrolase domain-containing protein [Leucobacter triazinivorans]QBE47550.1 class A beta-lactamase-related serine hydrolase [Leucobacter triazinivorans]
MPLSRRLAALALSSLVALTIAGCAASPGQTQVPEPEPAETLPTPSELEAAVERSLDSSGVPGAAVIVTAADGASSVVVMGEAAPGRPVEPETRFAYRSITKSLVGTVVLQLAAEGRVDLDAPVSDFVDGVPGGDDITVEQLGAMRSGIANYSAQPGLGELLSRDPAREPGVSELLALAYAESPVFSPGSAYEYSNTNTLLLGEIIERATGDSWVSQVDERIARPLGLESLEYGFLDPEFDATGFALDHGEAVEELPVVAPGWFGAAGGLTGDVSDLADWGRALGSGSLVDEAAQRERIRSLGSIADDPASPFYDRYGFALGELEGWLGHTGNGLGFQSLVMYDPESERVAAILINGTGEDPDLPAAVFADLLDVLPPA